MSKKYELKLDISKFYPTIYTHSITWALIGKEKAKKRFRNKDKNILSSNDENLYNLGIKFDRLIRKTQLKQTHGIPVGNDISFIFAELILGHVDCLLKERFPVLKWCRYYDDYSIYVDSKAEANEVFSGLSNILNTFGLEINESKVRINEAPKAFEEQYATEIQSFEYEKKSPAALRNYFNLIWRLCDLLEDKKDRIFKYGLKTLTTKNVNLNDKYVEELECLLYKSAVIQPSIIPWVLKLLEKFEVKPTYSLLKECIDSILKEHIPLNHHSEILWTLWLAKKYDIMINIDSVKSILKIDNSLVLLMILDYLHTIAKVYLENNEVREFINSVKETLNEDSLYDENWILIYEGTLHGWIDCKEIVDKDDFFGYLYKEGISFYDSNKDANYRSYDYLQKLPYDIYNEGLRNDAIRKTNEIKTKIYETLEGCVSKDKLDALNMGEKLFADILEKMFRNQVVNNDELVKDITSQILSFGLSYKM